MIDWPEAPDSALPPIRTERPLVSGGVRETTGGSDAGGEVVVTVGGAVGGAVVGVGVFGGIVAVGGAVVGVGVSGGVVAVGGTVVGVGVTGGVVGFVVTVSVGIGGGTVGCSVAPSMPNGRNPVTVPVPATTNASRTQQIVIMLLRAVFEREIGREGERVRPMNLAYLFDDKGL